jgi:hypothetical protein
MQVDFSHITATLNIAGYQHAIKRGDRVTDETLHDAVAALSPPPLPNGLMTQILDELDKKNPRTTPQQGQTHASENKALSNELMPDLLLSSVLSRLDQGLRYSEFERSRAFKRRRANVPLTCSYKDCIGIF